MPEHATEHPNPWPERDPRDVETSDQRPEEAPAEADGERESGRPERSPGQEQQSS